MIRHYLRVNEGRRRHGDILGYVACDQKAWPFRRSSPFEWRTDAVTLELIAKERWMMRPPQHSPLKTFP